MRILYLFRFFLHFLGTFMTLSKTKWSHLLRLLVLPLPRIQQNLLVGIFQLLSCLCLLTVVQKIRKKDNIASSIFSTVKRTLTVHSYFPLRSYQSLPCTMTLCKSIRSLGITSINVNWICSCIFSYSTIWGTTRLTHH